MRRRPKVWALPNSALVLIALTAVSYATTLIRERYFYQAAYGSHRLDITEVLLGGSALIGNTVGVASSFSFAAGRWQPRNTVLGVVAAVAVALGVGLESPDASFLIIIASSGALFQVGCQWAAAEGRQAWCLVGAVVSVVPTLVTWSVLGTSSLQVVLLGYATGYLFQGVVAAAVGLSAWGGYKAKHRPEPAVIRTKRKPSVGLSFAFPVLYVVAIQVDALIDQGLLLWAGPGWTGSASLAYSFFGAMTVVIVAPLGTQALAGRLKRARLRTVTLGLVLVTVLFGTVLPLVANVVFKGQSYGTLGEHRLRVFLEEYSLAVPTSIWWQFRTRVAHRESTQWAETARAAGWLLVVHVVLVIPVIVFRQWSLVPLATGLSFLVVAGRWALANHSLTDGILRYREGRNPSRETLL